MKNEEVKKLKNIIHNYIEKTFGEQLEEYGKIEKQYYDRYWWIVNKDNKYCKLELFFDNCDDNDWIISQLQVDMYGIMVDHSAKNIQRTSSGLQYIGHRFPVFNEDFMHGLYKLICNFYDKERNENELCNS